jgi:catechol 2,3-dioxygenase-like lactoylglutathione lyase family enzyme
MVSIHHDNPVNIISAGTNVYVPNVQRAHRWYSEILGLKMEMSPDGRSSRYSEPHSVTDRLTVFRLLPGSAGQIPPGSVQLSFSVPDLKATVTALRAVGVRVGCESSHEPGCVLPSVTVLDPDGNGVVLYES